MSAQEQTDTTAIKKEPPYEGRFPTELDSEGVPRQYWDKFLPNLARQLYHLVEEIVKAAVPKVAQDRHKASINEIKQEIMPAIPPFIASNYQLNNFLEEFATNVARQLYRHQTNPTPEAQDAAQPRTTNPTTSSNRDPKTQMNPPHQTTWAKGFAQYYARITDAELKLYQQQKIVGKADVALCHKVVRYQEALEFTSAIENFREFLAQGNKVPLVPAEEVEHVVLTGVWNYTKNLLEFQGQTYRRWPPRVQIGDHLWFYYEEWIDGAPLPRANSQEDERTLAHGTYKPDKTEQAFHG